MVTDSPAARISRKVYVTWALGTGVTTLLLFITNTFYLRFMTDYAGMSAAVAGGLLASMKILEVVAAPLVGIVSDKMPSRFGRRRPFLLLGAALAALSLVLMYTAPRGLEPAALSAYVTMALASGSLGYVIFNIPYLAMLAEMTEEPYERAKLVSARVYVMAIGQFVAGGAAPLLVEAFGDDYRAYGYMAGLFAATILLAGVTAFWGTRGTRATSLEGGSDTRFFRQLPTLFRSRNYTALLLAKATMLIGSTAHTVTATFYVRYVLEGSNKLLSLFLLAYSAGMVLSQVVWVRLVRAYGKVVCFTAAAGLYTVISLIWSTMSWHVPDWLIIALSLLNGAGAGGMLVSSEALLPDAIEDDCAKSGLRREGTLAAGFALAEKGANAVGLALVGVLLSSYGYDKAAKGAPGPEQLQGIMAGFGLMPAVFVAASCLWWLIARKKKTA